MPDVWSREREVGIIEKPALKLVNITKSFGENTVLKDLNLAVQPGDIFGFLGNNGSGKTTTIRILFGLIRPSRGYFQVFQHICPRSLNQAKKIMSGLVDNPAFYDNLSGRDNLRIFSSLAGYRPTLQALEETAELVGVSHMLAKPVRTYSNGQKKRLGIAQALLPQPQLIVLDEPTAGLDPIGVKNIRDLVIHLNREMNMTVFLSSHVLSEVQITCNQVAIIHEGRILKHSAVDELLSVSLFRMKALPEEKVAAFLCEHRLIFRQSNGFFLIQTSEDLVPPLIEALSNRDISIFEISPYRMSLEEVFLETIAGEGHERPDN
ncbi:MAG TPA: ABC transporter ATP-binding protein [Atribacteraceae bacterium]|nr:ABC transporter ATP-binding protein [Atribacteraceae bacterium]